MNKNKLKQYKMLLKEIEVLERKTTIVHDKVKGSSRHFPYVEQNFKIEGIPCNRLQVRLSKAKRLKAEIEYWIDDIKDPEIRIIMEMRYLWGYEWLEISQALGRESESYARKKHDRFLK